MYLTITQESFTIFFSKTKDVFAIIQIIISLFVVYMLYDRFGTSRKILEKQNDLIIEFVEELKKVRIQVHSIMDNHLKKTINFGMSKNLKFVKDQDIAEKRVWFKIKHFYDQLKRINEIVEHPLFPMELKEKADVFKFNVMIRPAEVNNNDRVLVSFNFNEDLDDEEWTYPEDGEMTLIEYLEKLENMLKGIEAWVNKESTIKFRLNFN